MQSPNTFKTAYMIVTGVALGMAIFGCGMLIKESRRRADQRDIGVIITGIAVACGGGLVMLITIMSLMLSKRA